MLIRLTTTTICGTDVHILKGEYPVAKGLTVGHEPVGVVEKLGANVRGYVEGQRVIAGAICPSGYSNACLDGLYAQDGQGSAHGLKPMGGWRFGNTIDGAQAEYLLVPDAMANLAPVLPVPRGQGADAPADECRRVGTYRSHAAGHAPLYARTDRGSLRALREPAGRRAQGLHNPLSSGELFFPADLYPAQGCADIEQALKCLMDRASQRLELSGCFQGSRLSGALRA